MITLEHRFYGDSQPFNNSEGGWSYSNLKYLNTTQALADIAAFIDDFKANNDVSQNQWLIMGGSYPGALVAWFKNLYPNHVAAVWSSSGVINPVEEFTEYDMAVYLQTQKHMGGCHIKITEINTDIESVLIHNSTADKKKMLDLFGVTNYDMDRRDFMSFIAGIWDYAVQYGYRSYLCDIIEHEWFHINPI